MRCSVGRALAARAKLAQARLIVAGVVLIFGLGRVGMFSFSNPTTLVPALVYGWLALGVAVALTVTAGDRRSRLSGRVVAGLGACVLAGLGADVWPAATSALILWWLAGALVIETVSDHDC